MSFTKLPSDLSVEDLEKLASASKTELVQEVDPVALFLSTFDIRPGKNKVHSKVLFDLYDAWSSGSTTSRSFDITLTKYLGPPDNGCRQLNLGSRFLLDEITRMEASRKRQVRTTPRYKKSFERFCELFKVRPGTFWVESFILYYAYDKWTYDRQHKVTMSYDTFVQLAKLYFTNKEVAGSGTMLMVASSFCAVSDAEKAELREGWKWRHAKKNKAGRREVSRAKAGAEPKD